MGVPGTVYLLHLDPPYEHAGHYLGWSENGVLSRVQYHADGKGNPLIASHMANDGTLYLTRVWAKVDRNFERRLKSHGKARLCPLCDPLWRNRGIPRTEEVTR